MCICMPQWLRPWWRFGFWEHTEGKHSGNYTRREDWGAQWGLLFSNGLSHAWQPRTQPGSEPGPLHESCDATGSWSAHGSLSCCTWYWSRWQPPFSFLFGHMIYPHALSQLKRRTNTPIINIPKERKDACSEAEKKEALRIHLFSHKNKHILYVQRSLYVCPLFTHTGPAAATAAAAV